MRSGTNSDTSNPPFNRCLRLRDSALKPLSGISRQRDPSSNDVQNPTCPACQPDGPPAVTTQSNIANTRESAHVATTQPGTMQSAPVPDTQPSSTISTRTGAPIILNGIEYMPNPTMPTNPVPSVHTATLDPSGGP